MIAAPAGFDDNRQGRIVRLVATGGDDTEALQAALDTAASGETIDFAAGDYHVRTDTLRSGVGLHGEAGAVLHAMTAAAILTADSADSHDISIDSLTFIGAGGDPTNGAVELSGITDPASVNRIRVTNSTFIKNGLTFDFLKNAEITGNEFIDIARPGSAIHGYHLDRTTIRGNTFTNVYQAIGLVFGGAPEQGRDVVIADNVGTGISRMGIEVIGQDPPETNETVDLLVAGNAFSNWTDRVADRSTMAFSIVTDGGTGTRVIGNYAHDVDNGSYGIELAGTGAVARGNYIDGFATGIIGYSSGSVIEDNNILNARSQPVSTYGRSDEIVRNNTNDRLMPIPIGNRARALETRWMAR